MLEKSAKKFKYYRILAFILAFALGLAGIIWHNLDSFDSLYLQSDDGDMYLSIADNFLKNGHFIQNLRPREHFVVPPGLPFMCTLLMGIGGLKFLLAVQYLIYGAACGFLALCCCQVAARGRRASNYGLRSRGGAASDSVRNGYAGRVSLLSALLAAVLAPAIYLYCCIKLRHPNPAFVLTENYVLFLLTLALYMLLRRKPEDSLIPMVLELFVLFLFRPACSGLLVICLAAALVQTVKAVLAAKPARPERSAASANSAVSANSGNSEIKRKARRQIAALLACIGVMLGLIGVNTAVNYRETGHIIALEDYGTLDIYLANNPVAGPDWYHSGKLYDFGTEEFKAIYDDDNLCWFEKNEAAGELLNAYVKANFKTVLKNGAVRYNKLFCETWGPIWWAFLAGSLLLFWQSCFARGARGDWKKGTFIGIAFLLLSIVPAFGLLVARYSAPLLPLYVFGIAGCLCTFVNNR